ncbi:MAGE-domain-containing protein [Coniophora puteana RWD-64-598 SS2]|uniref:MAGE-domain-containing protein n=1 Tax=Coniophora puteana (strain RWD-64-598) TaxID=741705 RepID=A0A5M3MET1_CONPW|nr:MAGE-domain-containing protein [Coniophora puteana RWD-64-598 SS2]EIW77728.1 MAGE-domain-containing protein [Coniophora puteana RWD-64-598 SS2]
MPARSQRRGTQPSQRTRRRRHEEEEEEEEEEELPATQGDLMDLDETQGGRLEAELDRKANDLVRLALFMEQKRVPLKREDITKKVLGSSSRSFNHVLEKAQILLRRTFAMELVELQARNYREADGGADELQEARDAIGPRKKGTSPAAQGSKTYILRSTLHPKIIEYAALTDERILEEQTADEPELDDDELPRSYGSVLSWSTADQLGAVGVLHVVLALILANGRVITDMDLRAYLKRLRLPAGTGTVPTSALSTHRNMPIDTFLSQLVRQGYLDRVRLGDPKGGAGGGAGKRGRPPAATQGGGEDGAQAAYEWRWGNRAFSEVGEKAVAEFMAEFMVERSRGEAIEEEEEEGGEGVERKHQAMFKGIERAAGGKLADIR